MTYDLSIVFEGFLDECDLRDRLIKLVGRDSDGSGTALSNIPVSDICWSYRQKPAALRAYAHMVKARFLPNPVSILLTYDTFFGEQVEIQKTERGKFKPMDFGCRKKTKKKS